MVSSACNRDLAVYNNKPSVLWSPRFLRLCSIISVPSFAAGKVEETPKKCKDLIHHARALLDDVKFAQFGESPREEVMTLERILLQTMNFDLQVDHSYSYLLK